MALKPIRLEGEQKKVLFLPATDPIQIKGVAGSGKTTVALYRAKHLVDTQSNLFEEAKVAIFTFNKSLVKYINALIPHVSSGYQKDSEAIKPTRPAGLRISVTNFDKWAFNFLECRGVKMQGKVLEARAQLILVESAIGKIKTQSSLLSKRPEFFLEEITWIKGKLFSEQDSYIEAKRVGRGTADRITRSDKVLIWQIFNEYERSRKTFQTYDFSDFAIECLRLINSDTVFTPPFTHLIIDEAQDLSKAEMLVLSKIVSQSTKSISIIADAAQRIYKSGFTWSEVGINVVGGRTSVFKKNYRNTEAVISAAKSLLEKEPDKSDFTTIEAARKGGAKPILRKCKNWDEQAIHIIEVLKNLKNNKESIVLLHRNWEGMRKIKVELKRNCIESEEILSSNAVDFANNSVKICTLSSIKGLEFDNVIIFDLNDDIIPFPSGFNDYDDEVHISTERRLLYTAMTRTREKLFFFTSGKPSRYLSEIDPQTLTIINGDLSFPTSDDTDFDGYLPF